MGKIVLGKVAFTPKGAYNPDEEYDRFDMVYDGLRIIISLIDHNTRPLSDENAWKFFIRFDEVVGSMIADGTITTPKLADEAVTEQKLSPELIAAISKGGGGGGAALSDELGNSVLLGVTQHRITERLNYILAQFATVQGQVNTIANQKATVELTITPSLVSVGEETEVSLLAETDIDASDITITRDGEPIAHDAGMTAVATDTLSCDEESEVIYEATFTIGGISKKIRKKILAVLPIFYGAGQSVDNAVNVASARPTPEGLYNISVNSSLSYLFFCIPATMTINRVLMNGFEVHFGNPRIVLRNGLAYKVYQSSNTYDTGTVNVEVS